MPADLETTHAWQNARLEMRRIVGDELFEIWMAPLELRDFDGTTVTLSGPPSTQAWVAERFRRVITRCLRSAFGDQVRLVFADPAAARPDRGAPRKEARTAAARPTPDGAALERFIPRFTFDQFIIGDNNRLAHAAALAVAEAPGHTYNPLFLYAPPGLGKTHLLHAIGNYILAFQPETTVRYATVESFTNHFLASLQSRSVDAFKHLYRDADVLLIDDVQFLASKARTEEEFFHTFNALHESGRQLVLTADRLPRQLEGIEDRLQARFEAGLVAALAPPDRATRIAILRKRAALDRIPLPEPTVLELIADRVTDNIRSLEGALIRVIAHHSLTGRPLDAALAAEVLGPIRAETARAAAEPLTVARVQELVAAHFQLTATDLLSSRRTGNLTWPRHLAIFLARELTGASYVQLGSAFGGRNHSTMLHACNRVTETVATSPEAAAELEALRRLLTAGGPDRDA